MLGRRRWWCYVNYAEGFSVGMPVRLRGKRGQAAGPERGVNIPLSANCLGVIVVYGEPNSAEWANTAVAVAETAGYALKDNGVVARRYKTRLGRLPASGATIRYRDSIELAEADALRVHVHAGQLEDDNYSLVDRIITAWISRR